MIESFSKLRELVESAKKRVVVVAAAHDAHTLEAVFKAHEEGVLDYILVGKAQEIRKIGEELSHPLEDSAIIHTETDEEAAAVAIEQIRNGKADFLQKGLLATSTLLKAVVNKETGIGTGNIISHVALLDIPAYHKIVGVTDGGMILYPDLEQKKAIVKNAVHMFHNFGYEEPKVAAVCAVEVKNPKMPETLDAAALKEMNENGEIDGCLVEGPISFDLAVNKESAVVKKYESKVTGEVDILLVPDICTGNIMVKGLLEFGQTQMAGCVIGAKCPIALNSRSATFEEKYYSLLACAYMAG